MRESYDVIVIGSGFGGAVSACRLAQAGRSVCVLERGRRWQKGEFPRAIGQVSRSFWAPGESYGFLEYRVFKKIDVIQGCGVGGGSLHYFNVTLRTPAEIFEKAEWPRSITRQTLDPYYDLVMDMLDAKELVPPAGFPGFPKRTEAFMDAARKAGRDPHLVPIAVYTGKSRLNPHSQIPQEACDYTGDCMLGCRLHAKNSLDLNYLPVAERNGTEIHELHQVEYIEPIDGGYKVHFMRIDPNDPKAVEPGHVIAGKVIVSAGTLGSSELLLRSRDLHKTLPRLSRRLGTRFSGNGDFLLAGTLKADREIDPSEGPSITAGADFSTANNRIFIEDLGYPNPFMWLIDGGIPTPRRIKNLFKTLVSYVLALMGCSRRHSRITVEADDLFKGAVTTNFLPYLGMGTDAANGRMYLKDGSIDIDWNPADSKQLFDEIEAALKEMSRSLNGEYLTSVLWMWPFRRLLTAHPLGGCFMGDSRETSVVNDVGEVWGYPDLYVVDGSVIPTALSVNPSATIAALAERATFWMIHGREMEAGDSQTPANVF